MTELSIPRKSWCAPHGHLEESPHPPGSAEKILPGCFVKGMATCQEKNLRILLPFESRTRRYYSEDAPALGDHQRAWTCLVWLPYCFVIFELFSNINI